MIKPLSRREVLKGLGITLGLPVLDAMVPSTAMSAVVGEKKYAAIYFPNGYANKEGPDNWNLSNLLSDLAPQQNLISVLRGIDNQPVAASAEGAHDGASACLLTCASLPPVQPYKMNGQYAPYSNLQYIGPANTQMSIDQVIADSIGGQSPRKYINVTHFRQEYPEVGYTPDHIHNISWRGNTPAPRVSTVAAMFNEVFGDGTPVGQGQVDYRALQKTSLLDYIKDSSGRLTRKLGAEDNRRIASYFESIREVEKRIQSIPTTGPLCSSDGVTRDASVDRIDLYTKAVLDLMVLAFQCGRTRVLTYQMDTEGSHIAGWNSILGDASVTEKHHTTSHYFGDPNMLAQYNKICKWYNSQFAYFVRKMQSVSDLNGTLLDNSMILYISGLSDGAYHSYTNLPIVLAGKGGGTITPGKNTNFGGAPLASLHLTMAQKMGVNIPAFGRVSHVEAPINTRVLSL